MIRRLLCLLFIIFPAFAYADMGVCYCLKVEITTMQNIEDYGYFTIRDNLSILEQNGLLTYSVGLKKGNVAIDNVSTREGYILSGSNTSFFNAVRSSLYDSISIYEDAVFLNIDDQEGVVHKLIGSETKIASADIRSFLIRAVKECSVGMGIRTKLSSNDKLWVETGKIKERSNIGGVEACSYDILLFGYLPEAKRLLIEKLKHYIKQEELQLIYYKQYTREERRETRNKIDLTIEELRKHQVLVTSQCAC